MALFLPTGTNLRGGTNSKKAVIIAARNHKQKQEEKKTSWTHGSLDTGSERRELLGTRVLLQVVNVRHEAFAIHARLFPAADEPLAKVTIHLLASVSDGNRHSRARPGRGCGHVIRRNRMQCSILVFDEVRHLVPWLVHLHKFPLPTWQPSVTRTLPTCAPLSNRLGIRQSPFDAKN